MPKKKPPPAMVSLALRLPHELVERLNAEVKRQNANPATWPKVTRTDLIRRLLSAGLPSSDSVPPDSAVTSTPAPSAVDPASAPRS